MPRVVAMLLSLLIHPLALSAAGQEPSAGTQAVVETSAGTFVLSFFPEKAPRHVQHFLELAGAGGYDGTLFHRVAKWGLVQGGDPLTREASKREAWGTGGLNKLPAEPSALKHLRGTLAAYSLPGKPGSGGDQFFICVVPQPSLDGQYTVYGFVAEGMEVIDRISESPVDPSDSPENPVSIRKVTLRPALPVPPPAFSATPVAELARYRARLETSLGDLTLEFFPHLAPEHVRNFLRLAEAGFYDGTAIHRVVRDFVIQTGLLSTRRPSIPEFRQADLVGRLKAEFSDTPHVKGTLSMARYDDPDSAETSFFICLGEASSLDGQYTVFGRVVNGLPVLDRFQEVEVDGETPVQRLELTRVTLSRQEP